jgi:hypothetical protein
MEGLVPGLAGRKCSHFSDSSGSLRQAGVGISSVSAGFSALALHSVILCSKILQES